MQRANTRGICWLVNFSLHARAHNVATLNVGEPATAESPVAASFDVIRRVAFPGCIMCNSCSAVQTVLHRDER